MAPHMERMASHLEQVRAIAALSATGMQPAVQPLTGGRLANVAWQSAPGKAPGADGWSVKRMRQWPDGVWSAIVTLISAVEHLGRWPEALRGRIICLTPKGGCKSARRPPWKRAR